MTDLSGGLGARPAQERAVPTIGPSADDANLLAKRTLSAADLSEGMAFEIVYPFLRDTYQAFTEDGPHDVETWRPGVEWDGGYYRDSAGCDAEGLCRFTVVSVHKPGRYPTRVFYTRQFTNPDGKPFGKGKLHMASVEKFRRLICGYRDDYDVGCPDASYRPTADVETCSVGIPASCRDEPKNPQQQPDTAGEP